MKIQQIKKYTVMVEHGETINEDMVIESFKEIGEVVMTIKPVSTNSTAISKIFMVETAVYTEA